MAEVTIRIALLGSTGSIGRQTLQVVRSLPGRFDVVALAAGRNLELLSRQVAEFKPCYVYYDSSAAVSPEAMSRLWPQPCQYIPMEEMASLPDVDVVVVATSGKAGLFATLAAVRAGKSVAIANKEPLVMAGHIITQEAELASASILPIDSEHSAIWQCLNGESEHPGQIILTASGGPFRTYTPAQLRDVTPEQALRHPSWQMGKKVTIDSATLMNKGLEVIEAHWLFGLPIDRIRVVVHPQSIIHSMVEFQDGSVKAQMSPPDMRLPIQYALSHPERWANPDLPRLDWDTLKSLTFEPPDFGRFPCLKLGIEAGKAGGTIPAVLCAADEVAVEAFLAGKVGFTDIPRIIERTLAQHDRLPEPGIEDILAADGWAREFALALVEGK